MLAVAAHFSKFCLHKNYILVKRCVVYMRKYPIYMNFECIFTENDFPCEFILSLLPCPCDGYYISERKEKPFRFFVCFSAYEGSDKQQKKRISTKRKSLREKETDANQTELYWNCRARAWLVTISRGISLARYIRLPTLFCCCRCRTAKSTSLIYMWLCVWLTTDFKWRW